MPDQPRTSHRFAPIAIVGRACVLPGALSPEELWQQVVAGNDLITTVPAGRWGIAPDDVMCEPGGDSADRTWSDRGGYVQGFDSAFDPHGFGIPADEILGLDPVFQWTFHTAREALRDAGYADVDATRFGAVFGNLSFPSAGMAAFAQAVTLESREDAVVADGRNRFNSGLPALMLERALGLGGSALALDAACASSLYAIKLACDALHDRRSDLMLAGAVNAADDLFIHEGFTALQALSRTGRSRPFHPDADGLVPAEGCGFVALRRLDDAVRDGDQIHGIIRGVGLSNDGRGRGMLVPAADGQTQAIAQAFAVSGLAPTDVSLLECHATGTAIGDATEITSSAHVYAGCVDLPIGSLKSNTGHLITAAGVAGLIKVIEAMRHEVRPPTLHTDASIGVIDESPFRVLTVAERWDRAETADGVLRAGVSAFGFGGNNAHLLVEEPASAATLTTGSPASVPPSQNAPIAIVGVGVIAASAVGRAGFTDALIDETPCLDAAGHGRMSDITLRLAAQKFPPNDLKGALSQQLAILQVADEALDDSGPLVGSSTGVYVGMGTDPQAARFGARWRLASLAREWGCGPEWIATARDAVGPVLGAAGVLGTMPNLVANRLNSQYDISGPSFTVSSEEHSGLDALAIAVRALRVGDIDAAMVGAVDLSCDPVHRIAAARVLPADRQTPGDAAVMLVVKRLDDAERDGNTVYAVVSDGPCDSDLQIGLGDGRQNVNHLFGHAHAASGLVHVAAAALMMHHRVAIGGHPILASNTESGGGLADGAGPRTVRVAVDAVDGRSPRSVLLAEATNHLAPSRINSPRLHVFSGSSADDVLANLAAGHQSNEGPARVVIVADSAAQFADRAGRARRHIESGHPAGHGVHFRDAPIGGEMAFVFTAGGAAYGGMGAQLLSALPELATPMSTNFPLRDVAGWIHTDHDPLPADYLWGTALLTQAHAQLSLNILGLRPDAAIGYSSGETNTLFAFGVWSDMDAMRREIEASGMLDREIGVEFDAVARAWGVERADWTVWNVLAPLDEVRDAIAAEDRVHLMLINTHRDVVISGDAAACDRVIDGLGRQRCLPVGYNLACHVPEVAAEFHQPWLDVHTRRVTPVDDVRFYSNGVGGAYEISTEACAATITAQAETTVDFPATIEAAYDDGVRIFVEHGPAGACTNFVREILAGRNILAVHLDRRDSNIEQVFDAVAALVAAGVEVDHQALTDRLAVHDEPVVADEGPVVTFPAHPAPMTLPPRPTPAVQVMTPAPTLPPVLAPRELAPPVLAPPVLAAVVPVEVPAVVPGVDSANHIAAVLQQHLTDVTALHQDFIRHQSVIHEQFLATRHSALDLLVDEPGPVEAPLPATEAPLPPVAPPVAPTVEPVVEPVAAPPVATAVDDRPADTPIAVPRSVVPTGPVWNKSDLQIHSSGRISELFGALFEPQDQYEIQCRMPEPPLLLADRVTGLVAEQGVLGTGTIWTETDVTADAWYLNGGYMPAGFMIESGQADLMLISYMGIDLSNKGERAYRLLGCTLTYHGDLPSAGETLQYEIRITGHAKHGDIRLFFFEYDCVVDGQPRLTVRDAQAGFFNRAELDDALGILWTPEAGRSNLDPDARVDPPVIAGTKNSFTRDEVVAFSEGRTLECFGPGFEWAETHTRTPKIQAGDQLFIDEIIEFDPTGGPWARGFMRCEASIADDQWFFDGHFKNDPCMPGNFMVEACIEAMSFYLAALGHTTTLDGWRFQPLPEQPFELKCRGEINPQTDRVAYELYVEEIWDGPHPTIICDVIGFVDGDPAFHAHRIGVELVPDWPLTSMPEIYEGVTEPVAVATDGAGFPFDWKAMISCAWGRPSDAFGPMYEMFDGTRRSPRLPGEPYHFISRVTEIVGGLNDCKAGMEIVCEYDIPDDAWYFDENGTESMPYAVLLEAALQPCGWVASAVGSATGFEEDLLFRNLDGTGTLVSELSRTAGTLTTRVKLTSVSQAGGMVIEGFDVECSLGDRVVYTMDTVFGFFPPEAFVNQVGLPVTDSDRALVDVGTLDGVDSMVDLTQRPDRFCGGDVRLANEMLLMVDRVTHVAGAGDAGLGVVRGEKDVDVSEWFFKAHFFQDPVQPGSLGIEALLQLLQFYMLDTAMGAGVADAHFEPILLGAPMAWKYRGQVTPKNSLITTVMEVTETGVDAVGPFVIGAGSLWCDGLRIYEVSNMGMRIVPADGQALETESLEPESLVTESLVRVNATSHPHLIDHSVNGTPVVPVVYVLEWFARAAAAHRSDLHLAGLSDVRVLKGLIADRFVDGDDLDLVVTVSTVESDAGGATLDLDLADPVTGRMHYRCKARLDVAPPVGEVAEPAPTPGPSWDGDVYGGVLFHGPAFQVLRSIDSVSDDGLTASVVGALDKSWPTEPWVTDPALLDGALQMALLWTEHLLGSPSLPTAIGRVETLGPPTSGPLSARLTAVRSTKNMVACDVSIQHPDGHTVARLEGVETHVIGPSSGR